MLTWIYRLSDIVVILLSISFTILTKFFVPWVELQKNISILVTIAVTFASFLFAGQSILLSLPLNNEFLVVAKKQGYLDDFHKLCRRAEITYVCVSLPLLFLSGVGTIIDLSIVFIFLYGFFYTAWALWLFGGITKHYSKHR